MTSLLPITDLDSFVATRTSWHALAEHVLAKARWAATGRIGLRAAPGGYATPHYGDDRRAIVEQTQIVREQYGERVAAPITTLAAAATFFEVELGAPRDVFAPSTDLAADTPLVVDAGAAAALAAWYAFGAELLDGWRAAHDDERPSLVQLWPEHFDLAVDLGDAGAGTRANFGASPGDGAIVQPYVYVGPWDLTRRGDDPFWNEPWGAALRYDALCAAPDPFAAASAFFAHGFSRLAS